MSNAEYVLKHNGYHHAVEIAGISFTGIVAPCGDQFLAGWKCGKCGTRGFPKNKFPSIEEAIQANTDDLSVHCCPTE